jgi:hypothetical protein
MAAGVLAGASGCAGRTELVPAPEATAIGADVATATMSDVRLTAYVNAWDGGIVGDLESVTPIRVKIENDGDRLLSVRYRQFALVTADEERRNAALPPFEINESEVVPIERLGFVPGPYPYFMNGFAVAPYLRGYYPALPLYDGRFLWDPYYYGTYYPRWVRVELPTPEMLRRALPEGVLRRDGEATGFLYFENLDDANRAMLTFELIDAATDASFGTMRIPFVAKSE